MSARFIDYFEDFAIPHDDRSKEYLEVDDLTVKGKFAFGDKKIKLSGKSKFNSGKNGLGASNDYSLTHTLSPWTKYILTHKTDMVMLDGNFKLYSQDKNYVSLYTNLKLEQNENKRELPSKIHVRLHHEDNTIFSVGIEKFDFFSGKNPDVISASGLFGKEVNSTYKAFGGLYSGFGISAKAVLFHKFLFALKGRDYSANVEFGINRAVEKKKNEETKEETESVKYVKNAIVRFDANVNKSLKVGGDLAINMENSVLDAKMFGQYAIDKDTFVKVKVQNDNSVTVGLTHNYRGLINFGFVSKFNIVHGVAAKEKDNVKIAATHCHFKTKFGILAELSETLI